MQQFVEHLCLLIRVSLPEHDGSVSYSLALLSHADHTQYPLSAHVDDDHRDMDL
jgi:hypothetical protein